MGWRQRRKRDSNAEDEEEIDNTVANDNKRQLWYIIDCHHPDIAFADNISQMSLKRGPLLVGITPKLKACMRYFVL
jgi:hypothetical protein